MCDAGFTSLPHRMRM